MGYRSNKKDYRFYNEETYQVLDQDKLVMYRQQHSGGDDGEVVVHYFSISASEPIHLLTRKNLLEAFSTNAKMVQSLHLVERPVNWLKSVPPNNRSLIMELYLLNK